MKHQLTPLVFFFLMVTWCSFADAGSEYDFVVVGGGSAGSVAANRLSEESAWSVLLLEAGREAPDNHVSSLPYLAGRTQNSDMDWGFRTEPDHRTSLSMNDTRSLWPRGKVLGGSSVLNCMMYVRGNRRDYDHWASLGNSGWGYDDVLPYFKKSEDMLVPGLVDSPYHGAGGYLAVENPSYKTPLLDAYLAAGQAMGYEVRDSNGEKQTGFTVAPCNTKKGVRWDTSRAFLRPVRGRPNLKVITRAHVHRVLLEEGKAVGVELKHDGQLKVVTARKEVILSAGALGSPHLLMLSGIGPERHLEDKGVPVEVHLSGVGQNLQDHVSTALPFLVKKDVTMNDARVVTQLNLERWLTNGTGPISSPCSVEAMAFVNTHRHLDLYSNGEPIARPEDYDNEDYPDIQLMIGSKSLFSEKSVGENPIPPYGFSKEAFLSAYGPVIGRDSWMMMVTLLRPKSRGSLELSSSDPQSHPVIRPNYLVHPQDTTVLTRGARLGVAISKTQPLQSEYESSFWPGPLPGCEQFQMGSLPFWECYVRHFTKTLYHPAGTCKMGPEDDPEAVVDSRLRVRGIQGLRVVDASVMPTLPSAPINAAVIMVAEKASDLIKQDWGKPGPPTSHIKEEL